MKKSVSQISISIIASVLVMAVLSLSSCKKTTTSNPATNGFSSVKSSDWRSHLGEEYTVEGYLDYLNGVVKIYSEPEYQQMDGIIPEVAYIYAEGARGSQYDFESLIGRKVRITGLLKVHYENSIQKSSGVLGDISQASLELTRAPQLIDSVSYFRIPVKFTLCQQYPSLCQVYIPPMGGKVAFLYSGGINSGNAHQRYYNDIKALYWILRNQFGYSDKNIIVCYKNGTHDYMASDTFHIDYDASFAGFNAAINDLQSKMNSTTKFFCFINNHGGGYSASNHTYYGGAADTNGDEHGADPQHYDEEIYYYGEATNIKDDLLAAKINSLTFGKSIFLLKPCFSGGLVWDLRGDNRVIISSGTEFQVTYPTLSGNYGELTYNFMSAITGMTPDGVSVDADTNDDGKVSMYEAYNYIKLNEHRNEQPQINDDGTGHCTTTPSSSGLASTVFL